MGEGCMRTKWHCDKCGKENIVYHDRLIDIWIARQFIIADHRILSPECQFDDHSVRVQTLPEEIKIVWSFKKERERK